MEALRARKTEEKQETERERAKEGMAALRARKTEE